MYQDCAELQQQADASRKYMESLNAKAWWIDIQYPSHFSQRVRRLRTQTERKVPDAPVIESGGWPCRLKIFACG